MRDLVIYYFEGDVPSLEEVCQKIKENYEGDVEYECHSERWEWDEDDYENAAEEDNMKTFYKDLIGVEQWPIHMHWGVVRADGEEIELYTYTCTRNHVDLSCCRSDDRECRLRNCAREVITEYGGRIAEVSEETLRQVKKRGVISTISTVVFCGFLAFSYFVLKLTVLQLFLILVAVLIIREVVGVSLAYKAAKRRRWL